MTTVKYSVPNIHCGHCIHTIQMEVSDVEGVQFVTADQESRFVEITFGDPATEDSLKALLAEINYPVAGLAM